MSEDASRPRVAGIEQVSKFHAQAVRNCFQRFQCGIRPMIFDQADRGLLNLELGGELVLGPASVFAKPANVTREGLRYLRTSRGEAANES